MAMNLIMKILTRVRYWMIFRTRSRTNLKTQKILTLATHTTVGHHRAILEKFNKKVMEMNRLDRVVNKGVALLV
jgi:hypothetical protein